jgi:hypothetical protein
MTHHKKPGSLKESVDIVVDYVGGAQAAADLLGVGRSTIDSWKNPERSAKPSLDQVIALDVLYANKSGVSSPTPIVNAIIQTIELNRVYELPVNLVDEVLHIRQVAEELSRVVIIYSRDGKLGSPARITNRDARGIRSMISEGMKQLARLSRAIDVATEQGENFTRNSVRYSLSPLPTEDPKKVK